MKNSTARLIEFENNLAGIKANSSSAPGQVSTTNQSTIGFASVSDSGTILFANDTFYRLLQFDGTPPDAVLQDQIARKFRSSITEFRHKLHASDDSVMQLLAGRDSPSIRLRFDLSSQGQRIVVAESSTKSAEELEENYQQTHFDPLTQLGNRRLLSDKIDEWEPTDEDNQSLALIMMDLDRFKQVNDTLGHDAGDALLKLVAERVKRSARAEDIIVRMGGDEFIILHTLGEEPVGAEKIAQRLVELIGRPFLVGGQQVNIGTSVGVAALHHGTNRVEDLMKHADLALYDAKAAGRSTHRFFNPELEKKALERRELELQLRRALSLKQFELAYQPQVDLRDGTLTGFEALIRWHTPDRGIVPPEEFIALAEDIGEIIPIGEWVLRTACLEAASWPDHLTLSVNISPVQFESSRFVDSIHDALKLSGLQPSRLEIEITEGILISNLENALDYLWAIQSMGVEIAMDDFGTGYSSLSYLNSFPFSKIKIDQSFVRGTQTSKSRALVDAIITLGESLGMKTLAEGVETNEQYADLSAGGCELAQGFLFSKPMNADKVTSFISTFQNNKAQPDRE